jgi:hypothetical protein
MIALTAQAKAQVVLDDQTPCSAAVEAFDSHDKEKMREVVAYIESVFGQLDQRQRDSGEVGMLAQPNDQEGSNLISVAVPRLNRSSGEKLLRRGAYFGHSLCNRLRTDER